MPVIELVSTISIAFQVPQLMLKTSFHDNSDHLGIHPEHQILLIKPINAQMLNKTTISGMKIRSLQFV